jgi:hypothetical protein
MGKARLRTPREVSLMVQQMRQQARGASYNNAFRR